MTFVVVRSGAEELGRWLTEHRDVRADFQRIYGEAPDDPSALSLSIDSNDTHTTAEVFFGPLAFRAP